MEAQAELRRRTPPERDAYLQGLAAGFAISAAIADKAAVENEARSADLHRRSNRQAPVSPDRAEQTKISAQVLDECAAEAKAIAHEIRERAAIHKTLDEDCTAQASAPEGT
jgi:hypothetical protein